VWVDAVHEGILVGKKLLDAGVKHLQVSVHDDPAGLALKSKRYRIFAPFIDRCGCDLLKRAHSVDTASEPMQAYYEKRLGVSSVFVYRYIHQPVLPPLAVLDTGLVTVGHVGSAYSAPEVLAFLGALRAISQADGTRFRLINFGVSPSMTEAEREFPDMVESAGNVDEQEIVNRLQKCTFLYSMYSFNSRHRIFRETSQPTKMSTYLMAAKPILVHSPEGSSTMGMLRKFRLGVCVSSLQTAQIASGIREILNFELERAEVSRAIEYYCGKRNLDRLSVCFGVKQDSTGSGI